jgi:MFS family permease
MRDKGVVTSLLILVAINILNFYDRHLNGALAEPMRKEFHLTDAQLGLLGSIFIWLYAIVGIPLGRIADRWSRKMLLSGGILIWSALTAYAGLATSYSTLVISRLGLAVGEAVVAPAATSWIGDLFSAAQRSRALALFMTGVPIGGALSYLFSGPVAQAYGWRMAMALGAAPAMVLIPALLTIAEPRRGAADNVLEASGTASMWSVLRIPTLWWIIASGALLNFNMYAVGAFLPAFMSRIHHTSLAESGVITGFVYLAGGVTGGLAAGAWGDRVARRRKEGRLVSAAVIALAAAPFAFAGIALPHGSLGGAIALLTIAYACLNSYYGLVYASIQDIVAPAQRGTAMAVYFMLMYLCGASFGPYLTGALSDFLARRAALASGATHISEGLKATGLQQAMLIIPLLSICLAAVLWAGSRTIGRDIARREEHAAKAAA